MKGVNESLPFLIKRSSNFKKKYVEGITTRVYRVTLSFVKIGSGRDYFI